MNKPASYFGRLRRQRKVRKVAAADDKIRTARRAEPHKAADANERSLQPVEGARSAASIPS